MNVIFCDNSYCLPNDFVSLLTIWNLTFTSCFLSTAMQLVYLGHFNRICVRICHFTFFEIICCTFGCCFIQRLLSTSFSVFRCPCDSPLRRTLSPPTCPQIQFLKKASLRNPEDGNTHPKHLSLLS